jgi:Ca2+-binding EF-hand superfamily protein
MIIGLTTLTNPNLDERLEWMFKFYDQKRMGYIEEYELKMAVKAILKMKNEDCNDEKINEIAQSIKKSMTNNENISKEEFIKGAKNCEQKYLEIICPSDV